MMCLIPKACSDPLIPVLESLSINVDAPSPEVGTQVIKIPSGSTVQVLPLTYKVILAISLTCSLIYSTNLLKD